MSLALLEAVRSDKLHQGSDVVVVYNGIEVGQGPHEAVDSLSLIHLGEHLERLTSQDLRRLDTQVPLETLRAVVDLAAGDRPRGARGPSRRHHVRRRRHAQGADDVQADELQPVPRLQPRRARRAQSGGARADQGHRPAGRRHRHPPRRRRGGRLHAHRGAGQGHHAEHGPRHAPRGRGLHQQIAPRPSPSSSANRPGRCESFRTGWWYYISSRWPGP